ncbi:hypothetical protein ACQ4PT_009073 [Festuca glaucescens]
MARPNNPAAAAAAFEAFRHVKLSAGERPDQFDLAAVLSACARLGALASGTQVHCDAVKRGFSSGGFCAAALLNMYARCSRMGDARRVFVGIACPDAVCWTSMISGYHRAGRYQEALSLISRMVTMGSSPDQVTCVTVISTLASLRRLEDATTLLKRMPAPSPVAWNAVISGYAQQSGSEHEVFGLYKDMKRQGQWPSRSTFASMLSAAANVTAFVEGQQVHGAAVRYGLDTNVFVGSSPINLYVKCGCIGEAMRVFDFSCGKNIVMWNAMLNGLVRNELQEEAIQMFRYMFRLGLEADEFTFVSVLGACAYMGSHCLGRQVHCVTMKNFMDANLFVANATLDMYSKFGAIDDAKTIFNLIAYKDSVSWNALIVGLAHNEEEEEAIHMLKQMNLDRITPDEVSLATVINACSNIRATVTGKQIHCLAVKYNICSNHAVGSSLIDLYSKHGDIDSSRKVLAQSKMPEDANKLLIEVPDHKSLLEWTAIISGYAQNGYSSQSFLSFWRMRSYDVHSDEATFASILKACSEMTSLTDGKEIHGLIVKSGFDSYETASSSLIDMYSKCGDITSSFEAFKQVKNKQGVTLWNSMIVGFAKNGYAKEALLSFQKMQESQIKLDEITFLGFLTACAHAGLISEGWHYFDSMSKVYGLMPRLDHYACFIDLLGRGGLLQEAQEVINQMPFRPDGVILATYLAACRMHKDEERGKIAANKLAELEPQNSSTYVLLSSLHAVAGNWSEAKIAREAMREKRVTKFPGCSWITVGNKTSSFFVHDKKHPDSLSIYENLDDLTGMMKKDDDVEDYDMLISA